MVAARFIRLYVLDVTEPSGAVTKVLFPTRSYAAVDALPAASRLVTTSVWFASKTAAAWGLPDASLPPEATRSGSIE